MPWAPKKRCGVVGCRELVNSGQRNCEAHRRERVRGNWKKEEKYKEREKFYDSPAWRKLRAFKMNLNPACELCLAKGKLVRAYMVDHITPINQGGDRLDQNNLQSLCNSCHQRKRQAEGMQAREKKRSDLFK